MRLNGKFEILIYLGKRPNSASAWHWVRERYATCIRRDGIRVFAISAELDALDRERCPTLATDGTDLAMATRRRVKRIRAVRPEWPVG